MNKIRLVAFDLDGTIGDTIPLCIKAFKEAVAPYIGHELSDDDVIRTFGLNEQGMIASLVDAPYKEKQSGIIVALVTGKGAKSIRENRIGFGETQL